MGLAVSPTCQISLFFFGFHVIVLNIKHTWILMGRAGVSFPSSHPIPSHPIFTSGAPPLPRSVPRPTPRSWSHFPPPRHGSAPPRSPRWPRSVVVVVWNPPAFPAVEGQVGIYMYLYIYISHIDQICVQLHTCTYMSICLYVCAAAIWSVYLTFVWSSKRVCLCWHYLNIGIRAQNIFAW